MISWHENKNPIATEHPEQSPTQPPQEQTQNQPAPPVGSSRFIRVSTNQYLPPGTKEQVFVYDGNGTGPREVKMVRGNYNNYQLEIELEEPIPDGTRYDVKWYTPQVASPQPVYIPQQPQMYIPQQPQIYIPQQPRMHIRHR